MATEQAQHLIAMSLGKIAASRNQRGGANLHRSLLVSTVLHKARTTIMMENFQAMMQQRRAQMEAQQQRVEVDGEEVLEEQERPGTPLPQQVECGRGGDKENWRPEGERGSDHDSNNNSTNISSTTDRLSPLQESTNNTPTTITNNSTTTTPNCAKCTKRRVRELGPSDDDFNHAKRAKFESDCELSHDVSSRSDCAFDSENEYSDCDEGQEEQHQPMQAETVQISSLVHRFNSGLSGLLTQVANEQHGHCSEQSFTSCCTQVVKDTGLDSIPRPCIALTV